MEALNYFSGSFINENKSSQFEPGFLIWCTFFKLVADVM